MTKMCQKTWKVDVDVKGSLVYTANHVGKAKEYPKSVQFVNIVPYNALAKNI